MKRDNFKILKAILFVTATTCLAESAGENQVFGIEIESGKVKFCGFEQSDNRSRMLCQIVYSIIAKPAQQENTERVTARGSESGKIVNNVYFDVHKQLSKSTLKFDRYTPFYGKRADGTFMYNGNFVPLGGNLSVKQITNKQDELHDKRNLSPYYFMLQYQYKNNKVQRYFFTLQKERGDHNEWKQKNGLEFCYELAKLKENDVVPKSELHRFNDKIFEPGAGASAQIKSQAKVSFYRDSMEAVLQNLSKQHKGLIAIPNFGNHSILGGGVRNGEPAQEEQFMRRFPKVYLSLLEFAKERNIMSQDLIGKACGYYDLLGKENEVLCGEPLAEPAYTLYQFVSTAIDNNQVVITAAMPWFKFEEEGAVIPEDEHFLEKISDYVSLFDKIKNSVDNKDIQYTFRVMKINAQGGNISIEKQTQTISPFDTDSVYELFRVLKEQFGIKDHGVKFNKNKFQLGIIKEEFVNYYINLHAKFLNQFVAMDDMGIEIILSGAFGCGVYHNIPEIVALAMRNVYLYIQAKIGFKNVKEIVYACIPDHDGEYVNGKPKFQDLIQSMADIFEQPVHNTYFGFNDFKGTVEEVTVKNDQTVLNTKQTVLQSSKHDNRNNHDNTARFASAVPRSSRANNAGNNHDNKHSSPSSTQQHRSSSSDNNRNRQNASASSAHILLDHIL